MAGTTACALARSRDRDFWTNITILPTTVAIEAPAATTKNVMYGTLRSPTHSLYVYFLLSRRKNRSPPMSYTEANKRASAERPNRRALSGGPYPKLEAQLDCEKTCMQP